MLSRNALYDACAALLVALATAGLLFVAYLSRPAAVFTAAASPALVGREGFHEVEQPFGPGALFRWSEPAAMLDLPRAGSAALLTLDLAGVRREPAPLTIAAGGARSTLLVQPERRRYHLLLPAPGPTSTRLRLDLAVPALDSPVIADGLRRGVLVGDIVVRGDGGAPAATALLLAFAAAGGYAAMRLAGLGRHASGAVVLAIALFFSVLQTAFVWQVRLGPELLALLAALCLVVPPIERQIAGKVGAPHGQAGHVLALCALALTVRLALVPLPDVIGDHGFFVPWGGWLLEHGLSQFYANGIDLPPLWPYTVWAIAGLAAALDIRFSLPLPPAGALLLKLPAILADLALVLVLYHDALRWRAPGWAFRLAAGFALLPPLWIDSAWWSQVDVVPILLVVLALLAWRRVGGRLSWALYGLALVFKAQAIVFAPLFVVATLRERGLRGLVEGGTAALAVAALVCAPVIAAGQAAGLLGVYTSSVDRYPFVSLNAYNLWALLTGGAGISDFARGQPGLYDSQPWLAGVSYHAAGLALMAALALAVCGLLARRSDEQTRLLGALLLALGFFVLPTQIHERYLLPVFPLLGMWLARSRWALGPLLVLALTGTVNLLRVGPLIPAVYQLLAPPAVALAAAALNVMVLAWLLAFTPAAGKQEAVFCFGLGALRPNRNKRK